MDGGEVAGIVIGIILAAALIFIVYNSIWLVREREAIVIERCGKFNQLLTPGCHCIRYPIDAPKRYSHRFHAVQANGRAVLVTRLRQARVSTQREVLDFPGQTVITRDGAKIELDAILNYRIASVKTTMYSTINVPRMLAKLLQAQVRNVAASQEVDQLIEGSSAIARLRGEMSVVATRWGIDVTDVRLQGVRTGALTEALQKFKTAELRNQGITITARSQKQQSILEGESLRDRSVREAEGEAAQILANARGEARAVVNRARAEAESIKEIGRAVGRTEPKDLARYLLAVKYMDALKAVLACPSTDVRFVPSATSSLQTLQAVGVSSVLPPSAA